jgi:putative membrane protein
LTSLSQQLEIEMARDSRLGLALTTAALALMASAGVAQTSLSDTDRQFIEQAAEGGHAEVSMGQSAAKSENPAVSAFGKQMIADHTKVADELKALAASKNVTLPDGPSVKQKAEIKLIDAGDNDKFDERYAKHFGVNAHKDTIKLFEDAAKNAKDPEVKAWAEKTLPGLKHHLEMAQSLGVAPKK